MEGPKSLEVKEDTRAENSSTADALAQMPNYEKFLKDLRKNKKKLNDITQVTINEECFVVLQNKLPTKSQHPGSFSIPCHIGSLSFNNVLCDLGSSINLMPYSLARKLGIGNIEPTSISLKFADRSIKYPRGIVENVIVKIDKFIYPIDFFVLDMDENYEVPMILVRLFLATSRALIDVGKRGSVRDNPIGKSFFAIDVVNVCVEEFLQGNDNNDVVLQPQDKKSHVKGVGGSHDKARHTTTTVDDPP
ncbi:uncharacterized protein [Henckelia pumila]|uniref:uncharacterized protein n=1 Tax=Henckelia pumila TaxID=405737 RepID=UPI003C6DE3DE